MNRDDLAIVSLCVMAFAVIGATLQQLRTVLLPFAVTVLLVSALVALMFWGILWGTWGMVLAIPLTTTIKIILENIQPVRPIAVLMRAKPDA